VSTIRALTRRVLRILIRALIKLNPEKCTFGVPSDKLLDIISARGTETNPMKVNAILDIRPPQALRDAQKLMGCLASLSRFISKLGERGLPLYKLLLKMDSRGSKGF
jgi:hypothetical protein